MSDYPNNQTPESGSDAPNGSVSVGHGQIRAAEIWIEFRAKKLQFIDILEMCAVIMLNVSDKSFCTDDEVLNTVRILMRDMRANAKRRNQ